MEKARQGSGRRKFREKGIQRTIVVQCRDTRKTSFGSTIQDPWNQLEDSVKKTKNQRAFRNAHKKGKNLI